MQNETVKICEGVESTWNYHLCHKHSSGLKALCRAQTIPTHLPVSTWGHKSEHIPESYCAECERLAGRQIQ